MSDKINDLVQACRDQEPTKAKDAFAAAIKDKLATALASKKVEVATTLLNKSDEK